LSGLGGKDGDDVEHARSPGMKQRGAAKAASILWIGLLRLADGFNGVRPILYTILQER
jgi:hypothetical protein